MTKDKIKFNRLAVMNRWRQKRYSRSCNWVIIGIQEWWAGPEDFCYKLCFFGVDFQFWYKRSTNKYLDTTETP